MKYLSESRKVFDTEKECIEYEQQQKLYKRKL